MTRLVYEFTESFRIAFAQIRANKMRSVLTGLGVIIGIVAVTLMGTAINGIDVSFQNSLAMLGDDIVYVEKWPWGNVEDWWNYQNRPAIRLEQADPLNRIIESTPNSELLVAVPVIQRNTCPILPWCASWVCHGGEWWRDHSDYQGHCSFESDIGSAIAFEIRSPALSAGQM